MTKKVMTPQHPLWKEFTHRLTDILSANGCTSKTDRPCANRVLKTMIGVDVDGSLKYFEEHGGYCDCEILMNVEDSASQETVSLN